MKLTVKSHFFKESRVFLVFQQTLQGPIYAADLHLPLAGFNQCQDGQRVGIRPMIVNHHEDKKSRFPARQLASTNLAPKCN